MKVSSKGEYALRALLLLGSQRGNVLGIQEISNKTLVSVHYLEQILLQLKRLGYLASRRGSKGGYILAKPPKAIIIGEVIRDLEGPLSPMGCASITQYDPCPLEVGCLLKPLWSLVRDTIAFVLDQTTLEDLLEHRLYMVKGVSDAFLVHQKDAIPETEKKELN